MKLKSWIWFICMVPSVLEYLNKSFPLFQLAAWIHFFQLLFISSEKNLIAESDRLIAKWVNITVVKFLNLKWMVRNFDFSLELFCLNIFNYEFSFWKPVIVVINCFQATKSNERSNNAETTTMLSKTTNQIELWWRFRSV